MHNETIVDLISVYKEMRADTAREKDANEWCENIVGDVNNV